MIVTAQPSLQALQIGVLVQNQIDTQTIHDFCRQINPKIKVHAITQANFSADVLKGKQLDVLILDDEVKNIEANDLIAELKVRYTALSIIVLTRKSDRKRAVEAMKSGATDYIFKRDLNRDIFEKSLKFCFEKSIHNKELKQRNVLIEALFEQSNDALFLSDANFNLIEFNRELEVFFDTTLRSRNNLLDLTKKPQFEQLHKLLSQDEQLLNAEFSFEKNDKRSYYSISVKDILLPELGARKLGTIYDVTARKLAQKEQLRSEKLQLTARMARIMAHEVRNPLTNISLSLDFVSDLLKDDEEGQMYVEIMERNTSRINTMIDDLLQSSKPFELSYQNFKVTDLVNGALVQTNDRRELLDIALETNIADGAFEFFGDLEKLKLVLINLITNALEAVQGCENPKLTLEVTNTTEALILVLIDNGKGMSDDVSEHLFDAFFSARKGGMGLGMTTVKNVVEGHDGKIVVKSQEHVGTEFIIKLPILNHSHSSI
ncbi:MAG: ATP-binding protein [Salibacteraceae bacterium]|jgi:signal transduction histidine kinase|nr:ATP-binding protein [Salibacteraceae bacterium]